MNAQTAVTTQICIPTTVQDLKAAYVEIYPNPSTEDITIRMSIAGAWNIDVLDAEGRVVLNEQMTCNKLVLSGLASGLYIARVSNSEHLFSKRFTVVRP